MLQLKSNIIMSKVQKTGSYIIKRKAIFKDPMINQDSKHVSSALLMLVSKKNKRQKVHNLKAISPKS